MLRTIKLAHTAVWAVLAGFILALPIAGITQRFRLAAILTAVLLIECLILALNQGRCPCSDLAARYTTGRSDNFDIYLPEWLARHNKAIFGTLLVVNELIVLTCWFGRSV
jgi:hypothetical protein